MTRTFVFVLLAVMLTGCSSTGVQTAQALGVPFAYKTKKVCKSYMKVKADVENLERIGVCLNQANEQTGNIADLQNELLSFKRLLVGLRDEQTEWNLVGKEFCELNASGIRKIKDDNPLFDRTLIVQDDLKKSLEKFSHEANMLQKAMKDKIKATVSAKFNEKSEEANSFVNRFNACGR